jgi:hypothetical protein
LQEGAHSDEEEVGDQHGDKYDREGTEEKCKNARGPEGAIQWHFNAYVTYTIIIMMI